MVDLLRQSATWEERNFMKRIKAAILFQEILVIRGNIKTLS